MQMLGKLLKYIMADLVRQFHTLATVLISCLYVLEPSRAFRPIVTRKLQDYD